MTIENSSYRVSAPESEGRYYLRIDCKDRNKKWRTVAGTGLVTRPGIYSDSIELVTQDPEIEWYDESSDKVQTAAGVFDTIRLDESSDALVLDADVGCHHITERVSLSDRGICFDIRDTLSDISEQPTIGKLLSHIYFLPGGKAERFTDPEDFAWLPNIHKAEDHICSDHFFRSPVACVAASGFYAALVPDLDVFTENCTVPHGVAYRWNPARKHVRIMNTSGMGSVIYF